MNKDITLEDLDFYMYDGRDRQCPFVLYKKYEGNFEQDIEFDFTEKAVKISQIDERYPREINMQELQAIFNKCKEYRWLDE